MDRRSFIKVTAVTGTSATLASCGNPDHGLIRFIPDEELVPGVATWKPSICPLCAAGCGVIARVMEGLPVEPRMRERAVHNLDEIAFKAVPRTEPISLDYFMRDYVDHLQHHVRQIEALLGARVGKE